MSPHSRREFLSDVGRGMLVAGLGSAVTADLGLAKAFADDSARLTFGKLEPLVSVMQETPIAKFLPKLVETMKAGTDLRTLVAAGSLANARTFGGQDYTGYHAFMALPPALEMTKELPENKRALPVLKVLYRNCARIQEHGGTKNEVLHPMAHDKVISDYPDDSLRNDINRGDFKAAEDVFVAKRDLKDIYEQLQRSIQDEIDVHRVVLAWRAWSLIDITGREYADTLLRQSIRYCVDTEKSRQSRNRPVSGIRELLPKLFDQYKLMAKSVGTKAMDDAAFHELTKTIYGGSRDAAAGAVAEAMAAGYSVDAIGEAMSAASTMLVLRDPGRARAEEGKPKGSVHGASVGVHASDSANAWRNIAGVSNARNQFASMIVGAYHTAGQATGQSVRPAPEAVETMTLKDGPLLVEIDKAVKANDQALATALVERYGKAGHDAKPVFDLMLKYAVSEDGALHAEKYYRTISEEFARTRPSVRWQHLAALARVTASEHGFPAAGYAEASKLMGV